jgi:superoxide dismutase
MFTRCHGPVRFGWAWLVKKARASWKSIRRQTGFAVSEGKTPLEALDVWVHA